MLELLRAAIDAADWPRALEQALEAWRALRAPELAELVEALGARCVVAPRPRGSRERHPWWIEQVARYDPAAVAYLVAEAHVTSDPIVTAPEIRARWGDANPLIAFLLEGNPRWFEASLPYRRHSAVDRLAAVLAWPPDPRSAALLAAALETAELEIWGTMLDPVCGLIADTLIALGDLRVLPRLAGLALRDPGDDVDLLTRARHAARVWHALDARRRPPDPDLAALSARLAPDPATPPPARAGDPAGAALAALWAQVAAHPDQLGPRLVLGDALVELGETRGELILLSCIGDRHDEPPEERRRVERRIDQLVEQQWQRWLGPLAPYLYWMHCELDRGMLDVVHVGMPDSPDTGWREAAGHHELFAVRVMRPHHVSPGDYAQFVEGLARLPRHLGLEGPEVIDLLRARLGELAIETVSYAHDGPRDPGPAAGRPLRAAIDALARLVPALEVLAFGGRISRAELDALLPELPRIFRRLHRVEVPRSSLHGPGYAEEIERYRSLPFVDLIPGPRRVRT